LLILAYFTPMENKSIYIDQVQYNADLNTFTAHNTNNMILMVLRIQQFRWVWITLLVLVEFMNNINNTKVTYKRVRREKNEC
jgi:ABC-type iron transport system FetAB ATPase subunit